MNYPWYDSIWLQLYAQARSIIAKEVPTRLSDFEQLIEPARTDKKFTTQFLPEFLDEEVQHDAIKLITELKDDEQEKHEFLRFGRLIVHDHPFFENLQASYVDLVSELAGETVEPSYNFLSLYNNFGICEPHMDSPISKWTLDICVDQSSAWPIHIGPVEDWPLTYKPPAAGQWEKELQKTHQGNLQTFNMQCRDALVFSGSSQWHYRDRIPDIAQNNYCHLVFLHYSPVGASATLDPESWAKTLNISALDKMAEQLKSHNSNQTFRGSMRELLESLPNST